MQEGDRVTNTAGGSQSYLPRRADLLPGFALLSVAGVLYKGARKYGEWNWLKIPLEEHLNHALVHLLKLQNESSQEDDLAHAACRVLFALDLRERHRRMSETIGKKQRPRAYIAGPISQGDLKHNLNQAKRAFSDLERLGYAVLCPHLSCYLGETGSADQDYATRPQIDPFGFGHERWLENDLPWVRVADLVYRLPGDSVGADQEVALAKSLGIPVVTSLEQLNDRLDFCG